MFGENVLRNTIAKIRTDSECAQKFFETLQRMKEERKVEYLHLLLHPISNVHERCSVESCGARELVKRCDDLLMWDSTHKTTKFLYRLGSVIVIDSERKSRPVLLSLAPRETAQTYNQALACWHNAFQRRLPNFILTDGDDSMYTTIASFPYSDNVHHPLCTFYLFDLNVKKKMMPILQAMDSGNGSQWAPFRKGLSM